MYFIVYANPNVNSTSVALVITKLNLCLKEVPAPPDDGLGTDT